MCAPFPGVLLTIVNLRKICGCRVTRHHSIESLFFQDSRFNENRAESPLYGEPYSKYYLSQYCTTTTSGPHTRKNGHVGPIHPYSQNIPNYIIIVFKSCYITLNQNIYQNLKIRIHVLQNIYQSHNPTFFLKAASSESRLPKHSLYLK